MGRNRLAVVGLVALLSAGCFQRGDDDDDGNGVLRPYRGDWIEVAEPLPFVHTGPDGSPQISTVTIGGEPERIDGGENFANRGDVIVEFWDREEIRIEYRPFTMSTLDGYARDSMDELEVLATAGPLTRPDLIEPQDDCLRQWQDGCQIRVWQAVLTQEMRAGADLRVTVPRSYRRDIEVVTSDAEDASYHNRGNVCVQGLPGSLAAEVAFGQVFVSLDRNIEPAPDCTAQSVDDCNDQFGRVVAESRRDAVNAFIDIPRGLWSYVALRGAPGCYRSVESDEFVPLQEDNAVIEGQLFPPVPGEITALGYQIRVTSLDCTPVPSTERPMLEDVEEQLTLGGAVVAHDRIHGMPCEELLAGG